MSPLVPSRSLLAAACMLALCGTASAQPMDDMCSVPKMKTDKWQARSEADGMTLLIPPGYSARGISEQQETLDSHFYFSGEHRSISVGSGSGPAYIRHYAGIIDESSECETVIGGRRVLITMYNYTVEDAPLSASGEAGPHFVAVARFYATGTRREVYVAFESNAPSDVKYFRQLFWTVSFPPPPEQPIAAASSTTALVADAHTAAGSAPSAQPPACASAPQQALPVADSVLDSSTVRSLLAGTAPIPRGFEVMSLRFDPSGALAGITVVQSDLPDATQRQLATLIASNLKPHDAHAPSSFLLRVEAQAPALRYMVLPATPCAQ